MIKDGKDITNLIKEINKYKIKNITVRDLFDAFKKGYVVLEYENKFAN